MDTRQKFLKALLDYGSKTKSASLFTQQQYDEILKEYLIAAKTTGSKTSRQYRILQRFSTIEIEGMTKLTIKNEDDSAAIRYIIPVENMFEKLLESHVRLSHGCRDKMERDLAQKYFITRQAIKIFISHCETCQLKKKQPRRGLVVKPIISNEFNSRCQVDLVDMQSEPDGQYKFIMVYQDHLTKFVQLRPLKDKSAVTVTRKLRKIFSTFGAPHILQR